MTMLSSPTSRRFFGLAVLLLLGAASVSAAPEWHSEVDKLTKLFDAKVALSGMKDKLEYFRLVFTALGYGAVMISALRKVTKAPGGEESMGWVASLVMTVALMATAPAIGEKVYQACDLVAVESQHDQLSSIKTCWSALLVILPSDSPVQEVLNDAAQDKNLAKGGPVQKQDASWTKLAWTWMKMAWSTMTNAMDKIGGALRAVANQILVMVLLFIPTVALIIGMVFIQIGGFLRELLHQSMDVFLPMMIAMLSFEPMRGAASNFVIKYISVAFWPVAWALGNALACSILISVMAWVVTVCQSTLDAINKSAGGGAPVLDPTSAGFLSGAAAAMPWGLLQVIILVITLTSLLIIASAIGAPLALTATMTKGACFATAQLRQAASTASAIAGAAAGGSSLALTAGAGGAASSGAGLFSTFALRASSSMGSAASRLAPLAALAGPGGMMASMGATALSKASQAVGGWASLSNTENAGGGEASPVLLGASSMSMMNTLPLPQENGESASIGSTNTVSGRPRQATAAVARSYRRVPPVIDL